MKLNLNKKTLNFILISIAFTIWIIVFLKIILPDNPDDEYTSMRPPKKEQVKANHATVTYDPKLQSDPFITPYNKKQPVIKKVTPAPPIREVQSIPPPQIRLLGIVKDEKGKLAIIRFQDGTTKFMRENEEVDNIKIIHIMEKELEYQFGKQKLRLML